MAQIADSLIIDIRATFEKLASDVNGAARTLAGFEKRFSVIGKGIGVAMGAGAALGVTAFVKTATTGFVEIGDRAGDVEAAFKRLGGTSKSLDEAKAALLGTVGATDLMIAANKGLAAGIPEMNKNFGTMAALANRFAEANGGTAVEALDKLITAIQKGQKNGLAAFQVFIEKGASAAEIMSKLPDAIKDFPAATDDVSKATDRLAVSWTNLQEIIGKAQNENPVVAAGYNYISETVNFLGMIIDKQLGVSSAAKLININEEITKLEANLKELQTIKDNGGGGGWFSNLEQRIKDISDLLDKARGKKEAFLAVENKAKNDAAEALKKREKDRADAAARAAEEAFKKVKDSYKKFITDTSGKDLAAQIKNAIGSGDSGAFHKLAAEYRTQMGKAADDVIAEWKAKGITVTKEQAELIRKVTIDSAVNPVFDEWGKQEEEAAKKLAEDFEKGFEDSVNFFSDIFTSVMEGSVMSLGDMLKQVAIGFAAQMAASMTGFSIAGGPGGIGMQIASSLGFGSTTQGINSVGGQIAGAGLSAAGAYFGSGAVATYGSGVMAGVTGTTTVASTAAGAAGVQAGAAMMSAAPYVAAAVGAYLVAKHFGAFGTGATNKETLARKDVVNWLEDKLKKDIKLGANDRFNTSAGFATLDSLPHHAKTAFQGVGGALNALLGITENTGGQIGAILADNYGSFDELKHMIQGLGVSLQEFTDKIIATGIEANDTWDTIQNKIDAVTEAMTPGLTAIGAYTEAINNLTASGGRGMDAIQGLQDAVIEAKEAGFRTLDQWKQKMLSEGKLNSDQINKIFQAFADMGITSMEQLANASVQQLGQIIARLFELGYAFEDTAKKAEESTTSISGAIPGSGTSPTTNSNANSAKGNVFSGGKMLKFARGGIFNSPTMFNVGLMGEAGPEAIMPLVRKNGRLGVRSHGSGGGGGLSINIDARGAAPGVEYEVARAIEAMKGELIGMSVAATQEAYRRRGTLSQG